MKWKNEWCGGKCGADTPVRVSAATRLLAGADKSVRATQRDIMMSANKPVKYRRTRHSLLQEMRSPDPCRIFSDYR
jgi:hypothetical protein